MTGLPGTGKSTIAGEVATLIGGPVLGHDWAMSGLRPFAGVWAAVGSMEPPGYGVVGWSLLLALARAELRRGSSVVLDGVARPGDVDRCRRVAEEEGSRFLVVVTECPDEAVHQSRIRGRHRDIPDWYELSWEDVQLSRSRWTPPEHADLTVQTTGQLSGNRVLLCELLDNG